MSKFRYLIIGTLILCVTLSVSLLNFGNDKKGSQIQFTHIEDYHNKQMVTLVNE